MEHCESVLPRYLEVGLYKCNGCLRNKDVSDKRVAIETMGEDEGVVDDGFEDVKEEV